VDPEKDGLIRTVKVLKKELEELRKYVHQLSEKGLVGEPEIKKPYEKYIAETDGLVISTIGGKPESFEIRLEITPPGKATVLTRAVQGGAARLYASVTGVVRKGSTWIVNTTDAVNRPIREPQNVNVWFFPIGILPPPTAGSAGKK
jgi:hypothetical protein